MSHSPLSSCPGLVWFFLFLCYLKSGHSPFLTFPRNTGWCLWIPHIYLSHSVPIPGPSFMYPSCLSWNILYCSLLFLLSGYLSSLYRCTLFSPHMARVATFNCLCAECFPIYYPPLSLCWKHNEAKDHKISHSSLPDTVKWSINIFKWMSTHEEISVDIF